MNDKQIKRLKELLADGQRVCWEDVDGRYNPLLRIGHEPKSEVEDGAEPEPVAYLQTNGFIALWNCDQDDFFTTEQVF